MPYKQIYILQLFFCCLLLHTFFQNITLNARSPFRKHDPKKPIITTWQQNDPSKTYQYSDWYYYENPFFTAFNESNFFKNLLPEQGIFVSENKIKKNIPLVVLKDKLETLVLEILEEKSTYTYFDTIQDKNFNQQKKCGLIVLRFKEYPLVVKLFVETPKTIINPFCKGFENRIFHFMGHGANRHIAGLTRIPNLASLHKKLAHSQWNYILPRKWFWLPENPAWIVINGENIGNKNLSTTIPGIYAIIADEIKENSFNKISKLKRDHIIMDFCNDMDLIIDPHENNFIVEHAENNTLKIGIIDTEHFPTLVGIPESSHFSSHLQWYFFLAGKSIKDLFFTSKKDHREKNIVSYPVKIVST